MLSEIVVLIRGAGEMASGVAWRLHQCGFHIILTEKSQPMAVRRKVSFCEAVYEKHSIVEGIEAQLIKTLDERLPIWDEGKIPLIVDPGCESKRAICPNVLVDAVMAKKNVGTSPIDATSKPGPRAITKGASIRDVPTFFLAMMASTRTFGPIVCFDSQSGSTMRGIFLSAHI